MRIVITGLHNNITDKLVHRASRQITLVLDESTFNYLASISAEKLSQSEFSTQLTKYYSSRMGAMLTIADHISKNKFRNSGASGREIFIKFACHWVYKKFIEEDLTVPLIIYADFNLCSSGSNIDELSAVIDELLHRLNQLKKRFAVTTMNSPVVTDYVIPVSVLTEGTGTGIEGQNVREAVTKKFSPSYAGILSPVLRHMKEGKSTPSPISPMTGAQVTTTTAQGLNWPMMRATSSSSSAGSSSSPTLLFSPVAQVSPPDKATIAVHGEGSLLIPHVTRHTPTSNQVRETINEETMDEINPIEGCSRFMLAPRSSSPSPSRVIFHSMISASPSRSGSVHFFASPSQSPVKSASPISPTLEPLIASLARRNALSQANIQI